MSEPRKYESVPKRDESMSTSLTYDYQSEAAREAFDMLNAATRNEFRGWGDTKTAARDRAAQQAGVTTSQAERLWKNWQTMKHPNGDVYRLLRNKYGHLCSWVETAADRIDRAAGKIEESNAARQSHSQADQGNRALD